MARRAAGYGAKVAIIDRGPSRDADGSTRQALVPANAGRTKKIMFAATERERVSKSPASPPASEYPPARVPAKSTGGPQPAGRHAVALNNLTRQLEAWASR